MDSLLRYQVWTKGRAFFTEKIEDAYGLELHWREHGNRASPYGWEMDHWPIPKAMGGPTELWNLRPLHWRMNVENGAATKNVLAELSSLANTFARSPAPNPLASVFSNGSAPRGLFRRP